MRLSCADFASYGLINTEIEGGYFGVFFSEIGGGRSLKPDDER